MEFNKILLIGLLAQLLFSARLLIQWYESEKNKKVESPVMFWILSIIASSLLIIYGVLRKDIVIVGGQIISYYIYIRNLQLNNLWEKLPDLLRHILLILPMLGFGYLFFFHNINAIIHNDEISRNLLVWGGAGQTIFTLRFIYQWYASEKAKESIFPFSFWIISLTGSLMIIIYGIFRKDVIIIMGQMFGVFIYIRNVMIHMSNHKNLFFGK